MRGDFARGYFQREVDPLLTPISIDPAHPFPRVLNKALCLALLLRAKRRSSGPQVLGVVTVPRALPRFVRLPCDHNHHDYLLLQDLIEQHLGGHVSRLRSAGLGGVPRNAQLEPLLRGRRSAVAAGNDPRGTAQPPQGRCGAAGD